MIILAESVCLAQIKTPDLGFSLKLSGVKRRIPEKGRRLRFNALPHQ